MRNEGRDDIGESIDHVLTIAGMSDKALRLAVGCRRIAGTQLDGTLRTLHRFWRCTDAGRVSKAIGHVRADIPSRLADTHRGTERIALVMVPTAGRVSFLFGIAFAVKR